MKAKKPGACSENSIFSSLSGIWYMDKGIVKDQARKEKWGHVGGGPLKVRLKNWDFYQETVGSSLSKD